MRRKRDHQHPKDQKRRAQEEERKPKALQQKAHDEGDGIDLVLRHVSRKFPKEVLRGLFSDGEPVEFLDLFDTQVTGIERRLDRSIYAKVGDTKRLLHIEWALRLTRKAKKTLYEYFALTTMLLADEAHENKTAPTRLEIIVVVLSGREKPWPKHGAYRTSPKGKPFSGMRYRIEPVYQRTVAELEARGPFWTIFAPLAKDADPDKLAQVLKSLRSRVRYARFKELAPVMAVVADADSRERGHRSVIRSLLPRELVMQNWIYKEGEEAGLKKGEKKGEKKGQAEMLLQVVEQRLQRRLTAAEQTRLEEQLRTQGAKKAVHQALNLSPKQLAAWLAASGNGHRG